MLHYMSYFFFAWQCHLCMVQVEVEVEVEYDCTVEVL